MKKQTNQSVKAHLLRGALILLSLLAICVIPFALASRSRGTAQAGQSADGVVRAPAATDISKAPSLPRTSQIPLANTGVIAAHVKHVPPAPKAPQGVLYDQYDNAGTNATWSGTLTDFTGFDADLADDFVVPGGQTWNVESIDADGTYFNGSGPADSFNVFIYVDSGGLPGTQVYSTLNQTWTQTGTTFTVDLSPAAVLTPGTYWIEIQANMTFSVGGQWGWTDRTVLSNSPAAWQNPGGGFGTPCTTWGQRGATCGIDPGVPDQVYRINGTIVSGTPSPTPTPTASPTPTPTATCQVTYTTATGTGTVLAGGTDIGNHCDDCFTQIDLPFPVNVYGAPVSVAYPASNGDLHLANPGTKSFAYMQCVPVNPDPPDGPFLNTLFPYYGDLRTDETDICPDCGIFTQTLGSAPNRQFVIRWKTTYFTPPVGGDNAEFEVLLTEGSDTLSVIYGASADTGLTATSGIQQDDFIVFTSFSCFEPTLTEGLRVDYIPTGCGSPTPTPTATATATPTSTLPPRTTPTPRPRPTPPPRP